MFKMEHWWWLIGKRRGFVWLTWRMEELWTTISHLQVVVLPIWGAFWFCNSSKKERAEGLSDTILKYLNGWTDLYETWFMNNIEIICTQIHFRSKVKVTRAKYPDIYHRVAHEPVALSRRGHRRWEDYWKACDDVLYSQVTGQPLDHTY